jgi:glucosamine--fructose-6-phosphate aminotransferase (isomerizing)
MYLLALRLAELRGTMEHGALKATISEVKRLPSRIAEMFERHMDGVETIARAVGDADFFLYLGRHVGLPVALEGALKLKEISYIATDAYAAGEMKHGPIALLDQSTPVVVVATQSPVLEKVISNIQEVRARGAHVIAIATDGNEDIQHHADDVIFIPRSPAFLQTVLAVVPLQLLAYRIARLRGLNVDQPRNLAKTVTVE